MANLKILNETPLSTIELKEKIEAIKKRNKELGTKTTKTIEYLKIFASLKKKETEEIKKKILGLNIPRLKDRHIIKILDIMPKDIESLKLLFTGENITIKQEDVNKILEVITK